MYFMYFMIEVETQNIFPFAFYYMSLKVKKKKLQPILKIQQKCHLETAVQEWRETSTFHFDPSRPNGCLLQFIAKLAGQESKWFALLDTFQTSNEFFQFILDDPFSTVVAPKTLPKNWDSKAPSVRNSPGLFRDNSKNYIFQE